MKTATEVQMEFAKELRLAELRFWRNQHPEATVEYDKKNNQIVITYPLPTDLFYPTPANSEEGK